MTDLGGIVAMHPLLKRILIRGTFVAVATTGVALLLQSALVKYVNSQPNTTIEGPTYNITGAVTFGILGLLTLALLEWIAYAREKTKKG